VGPNAQVLGAATVTGSARIEDYAIVKDNAQVSGSAIIRGHSIVGKNAKVRNNAIVEKTARVYTSCNIYGNAIITGSAIAYSSTVHDDAIVKDVAIIDGANLSGDVIIGGDAEDFTSCSSGTYLQLYKIAGRSKGCDGNHEHILNIDVNPVISDYPIDTLVRTNTGIHEISAIANPYVIYYSSKNQNIVIEKAGGSAEIKFIRLITMDGKVLYSVSDPLSDEISIDAPAKGLVIVMVADENGIHSEELFIP
jgi:NDP-sugar pyrophosphorylase family protein